MTTLSLSIPQSGSPDSTEEPKIASDLTAIQSWANGNIDASNISAAYTQAAGVNVGGTTVKGVSFNAGPGTRTNVAYGALGDAADQVTGITVATNGLLRVWFSAQWQESAASNTARAAIFIGANQLKVQSGVGTGAPGAVTQAAMTPSFAAQGINLPLTTSSVGLVSAGSLAAAYGADVTTGQAVGSINTAIASWMELGGSAANPYQGASDTSTVVPFGGPCEIQGLPAGTYTISVQYKVSSGTVTVSNRRLWVEAKSFA